MKCIVSYGCSTTLDVYDLSKMTIDEMLELTKVVADLDMEFNIIEYKRKEQ